jgi:predicted RNA binding protein YcfA (HicA-like mRNA interferase family)
MSQWSSAKARKVLAALEKIGWNVKRQTGSHKILERDGWEDYVFAFRDSDEIGVKMLARIAKKTGLKPENI